MPHQDKNNQNYVQVGRGEFPSERGVPERRGVFLSEDRGVLSKTGGEHPVIASQCHPSIRGESAVRVAFPSMRGVPAGRGVLSCSVVSKGWGVSPCVPWHELPFNPKLKQRAKELRKAGNLSEVLFWNQVKNKKFFNLDFDRQKIIGNYIVDFYCKDLGVVVEIDGESHDNKQEYDKERDDYLESFGLKIFHIQDVDVKKNIEGVMGLLRENTPLLRATPLKEGNLEKGIKQILTNYRII